MLPVESSEASVVAVKVQLLLLASPSQVLISKGAPQISAPPFSQSLTSVDFQGCSPNLSCMQIFVLEYLLGDPILDSWCRGWSK